MKYLYFFYLIFIHILFGLLNCEKNDLSWDEKLLLNIVLGDIVQVKNCVHNGASVLTILTPYVGEHRLGLGKPWVNFPVAPALHVAINGGTTKQLNIATFLLSKGADPSVFLHAKYPRISNGFPPALMFAAGYGVNGSIDNLNDVSGRTELARRLYIGSKSTFNITSLDLWASHLNPPLPALHAAVYANSYDGVYLLLVEFNIQPDSVRDDDGATALHAAASLGAWRIMQLLLHNGANPTTTDNYGRTPMHKASSLGSDVAIAMLIYEKSAADVMQMISKRDAAGRSSLDLSRLQPRKKSVEDILVKAIQRNNAEINIDIDGLSNTNDDTNDNKNIHEKRKKLNDAKNLEKIAAQALDSAVTQGWMAHPFEILEAEEEEELVEEEVDESDSTSSVSMNLWSSDVGRVDPINLDSALFRRNYWSTIRPVVLTGNTTSFQPMWRKGFGSWDTWVALVEDVPTWEGCPPTTRRQRAVETASSSMRNTLERWENNRKINPDKVIILQAYSQLDEKTINDIEIWPLNMFSSCSKQASLDKQAVSREVFMQTLLGSSATEPAHFCTPQIALNTGRARASWHMLVVGVVEWLLFTDLSTINEILDDKFRFQQKLWRDVKLPKLLRSGRVMRTLTTAGETLFVPAGWAAIPNPMSDAVILTEDVAC